MPTTPAKRAGGPYPFRRGRYFEKLPPRLDHATVGDALQFPLLIFPAETPLRSVAQSMAANRVHSVVVRGAAHGYEGWGVITDATLVDALAERNLDATAGELATAPAVTAGLDQPLLHAADLMRKGRTTHLLVLDPDSHRPTGILAALDLAATWTWGTG